MGAFRWLWVWVLLAPQVGYAREVFGAAGNFSETRSTSREPVVEVVGTHVFTAWIDMKTGYGDVYFRRSEDRGLTFGVAQKLSDSHARAWDVQVTRIEGHVYVVWAEDGIRLRTSHDFGATFGPIQVLSERGTAPRIVATGGNVYVGWRGSERGGELHFRVSHDFGDSFEAPVELTEQAKGSDLSLAAVGDSVYAVWDDDSQVFFRRSMDKGHSFMPTRVLDEGSGASGDASLVAQGTGVYVVWTEGSGCASEIVFRRSITHGDSFDSLVRLSDNTVDSLDPLLEVKDTFVYVLWKEKVGGSTDIFFTRSIDLGGTFEAPRNISNTLGKSSQYAISTSSGFVRIVWRDRSAGGGDIFYRSSPDRGVSFGETQNLSRSPGKSTSPVIISSGRAAEVHVLWEEDLPGNRESFYLRGVLEP